jgi:transcriptional regulator with XRE-family HTH domain
MTVRTPMGPAVVGGRLDRLHQVQVLIRTLVGHGMTMRSIATALGYRSYSTVSGWRAGKKAPSAEQLAALRRLLEELP